MAQLWIRQDGEWAVLPLEGQSLCLDGRSWTVAPARNESVDARDPGTGSAGANLLMLLRAGPADDDWCVLAPRRSGLRVNGLLLAADIKVLDDRDELALRGAEPAFFSTERLAQRVPLPDTGRTLFCPRCRDRLEPGSPAVRCPGCGLWHHSTPELPCWTYAPRCAQCEHPTDPDAGYRWTPEQLR